MRETTVIRSARDQEQNPYRRLFTYPKWNRLVRVTDQHQLFGRLPEFATWSKTDHERAACAYLLTAKALDSAWGNALPIFAQLYGEGNGVLISGVYRDH